MKRRDLLRLACVSLAGVALPARAQQSAKVPRIGFIDPAPASDSGRSGWRDAFEQGLRELGWIPGRNIEVEYRRAGGGPGEFAAVAAEMSRLNVSVIVTGGEPLILAAQKANPSTPIVMAAAGDPVVAGFAKTLARPGGSITGMSSLVIGVIPKWVELLRELAPGAVRMAMLRNLANPTHEKLWSEVEAGAAKLGVSMLSLGYRSPGEIEKLLADAVRQKAAALLVLPDPIANARADTIAATALRNRLPSAYRYREHAVLGGLISYGHSQPGSYRRAATFVDKILRGANPGDLPIEQAREFDLVINLKTAKALGLKVPQSMLLRATEVIE